MMKRTVVFWSATGMLLTMMFSSAAVGLQNDAKTLMALSGFDDQLKVLPEAVNDSFNSLIQTEGVVAPFETTDIPELKKAVASVFETEVLRAAGIDELYASMSVNEMGSLISFFSSSQGASLRQAEIKNSILEHTDRFQQWYEETGMRGLDNERQNAFYDLERAMRATEGAVDAMIGMQVAMQVSLTPVLPAEEQLTPRQLLVAAQEQRPELTRLYRQSSLETLAFVFHDQSTDAIKAYIDVLDTQAGQRYTTALNQGLNRGLFNAAEQLGLSLQVILQGRVGQGV